jgi:hypothetical protein
VIPMILEAFGGISRNFYTLRRPAPAGAPDTTYKVEGEGRTRTTCVSVLVSVAPAPPSRPSAFGEWRANAWWIYGGSFGESTD